jgi:penicillin-binding protein 2
MGLKAGFTHLTNYSHDLGFGSKTGVPLVGEAAGSINDLETIKKIENRVGGLGDIANFSIGQGHVSVTTLQVAKALTAIANGGTVYQPRLVLQVQGVDDKINLGYDVRVRHQFNIDKEVMSAMRSGMHSVVYAKGGTAHAAQNSNLTVAGKTGTAQWGSGKKERVAAWFGGYAPEKKPQWAFGAVYEGLPGNNDVHGGTYVGPIISRALAKFPKPAPEEKEGGLRKKKKKKTDDDDEDTKVAADDEPPKKPKRHRSESDEVVQ